MLRKTWQSIRRCHWIIYIYLATFLVILPLLFHQRVFTIYYHATETQAKNQVYFENDVRVNASIDYFAALNAPSTKSFYEHRLKSDLKIIIMLITVQRQYDGQEFNYPIQVAAECDKQIAENPKIPIAFVVCNVDDRPEKHKNAKFLSTYFPTVTRPRVTNYGKYEKEKEDYVFCLEKSLQYKTQFVMLLEDDSIPRKSMFRYLNYILENKIKFRTLHSQLLPNSDPYLAVKLYYPLRWSGFGFELSKIIEVTAFGCIGIGIFALIEYYLNQSNPNPLIINLTALFGGLYTILIALFLQRPNLLELRWLHPSLFRVVKAPGCCTQAMIYAHSQISDLLNYLNMTKCTSDFAVDLAIDDYSEKEGLPVYMIEPNLFHHVGFYSSLTNSMKTPTEEFLFD